MTARAGGRPEAVSLLDVRCMFVSVERLLDPSLRGQPVVSLSNSDGVVVSRSDEAKALGVGNMAAWFELKRDPRYGSVIPRSSNYQSIGDVSARFYATVGSLVAEQQVYSVDEVFLSLHRDDPAAHAAAVQRRVAQWVGLPTACGISTTKTLAKVAQRWAKQQGLSLFSIYGWSRNQVDELLAEVPVSDVWGVGRALTEGLAGMGVRTALDLARTDPRVLRRRWSVVIERTARELAGTACIPVLEAPPKQQEVMHARILGDPVTTRAAVREVATVRAVEVARRLQRMDMDASLLQSWASTSRFREQPRTESASVALDPPTNETGALVRAAWAIAERIEPGEPYNRLGLLATGLSPAGSQPVLFGERDTAQAQLGDALRAVESRFGRNAVGYGRSGLRAAAAWAMKADHHSGPRLTSWDHLLTVR